MGGPAQVLDYLGRYTHRVAISNQRLVRLEDGKVTFRWKDYTHGNRVRVMTLDASEFIRRFLLHVLPLRFSRLRHYGLLSNRNRARKLAESRRLLQQPAVQPPAAADWKSRYEVLTGESFDTCPSCRLGRMVCVDVLTPFVHLRAPRGIDSS